MSQSKNVRRVSWFIVVALLAGAGLWQVLRTPRQRGPVDPSDLKRSFVESMLRGPGWQSVEFSLTAEEERGLDRCLELTNRVNAYVDGVSRFLDDETREELESVLETQPRFFYAEYLLGLWHDMSGNASEGARWHALALSHAPVVLEQRYVDQSDAPLPNVSIQELAIECNRVENGSLDPSLKLRFFHLVTDADGAVRLPVYDTVFRLTSASHPEGYDADYPAQGWFESRSKTGVLPAAVLRKKAP